ncbi:MAG TPA: kelch repeat-containing protein, partial [Gammaproteobacteria bacterium]|nr:kelch repeat-containing protein [Gammaproteobacteria bacterium]
MSIPSCVASLAGKDRSKRCFPVIVPVGMALCVAFAEASAQWTRGKTMLSTRTEVSVAAIDERIYVAGGFGGGQNLEIYDPQMDRWSLGAPVPEHLHHAAAVTLDGRL